MCHHAGPAPGGHGNNKARRNPAPAGVRGPVANSTMPMTQIVAILLLCAIGAWWWHAMQARETAARAARNACRTFGTQFLDDTVALRHLRPRRDASGRVRLLRVYQFEFTQSGGERNQGYVTLRGRRVLDVHLDAVDNKIVPLHRTLH